MKTNKNNLRAVRWENFDEQAYLAAAKKIAASKGTVTSQAAIWEAGLFPTDAATDHFDGRTLNKLLSDNGFECVLTRGGDKLNIPVRYVTPAGYHAVTHRYKFKIS